MATRSNRDAAAHRRSLAAGDHTARQDRGWGLFCQMSVAPLLAGTLEWLIAVGACWLIGAPYTAPWTWLAHLAAVYPWVGVAAGLRALSLAWAGWAFLGAGMEWGAATPYLWIALISALAGAPHRWGVWAARVAVHGLALWFILQMDHITGLIGLVGLLMLLL